MTRWPFAWGGPVGSCELRVVPEDFQVDEQLKSLPTGYGSHTWLQIEKVDANTGWVAARLAEVLAVRPRDVGFAGRKDRRAVTRQWFSVPTPVEADELGGPGWRMLRKSSHPKKLRRGQLAGNQFQIRMRSLSVDPGPLEARTRKVAAAGVPNYFGPQRFGREGSNLRRALALAQRRRMSRDQRSLALSAARSFLFNEILGERVREGSWNRLQPGDMANLAGSGSVFAVESLDETLQRRLEALDIHPSVPLWGRGDLLTQGEVRVAEEAWAERYPRLRQVALSVAVARRAARSVPANLSIELEDPATAVLRFELPAGEFATSLLRELVSSAELEFFLPDGFS